MVSFWGASPPTAPLRGLRGLRGPVVRGLRGRVVVPKARREEGECRMDDYPDTSS